MEDLEAHELSATQFAKRGLNQHVFLKTPLCTNGVAMACVQRTGSKRLWPEDLVTNKGKTKEQSDPAMPSM